MCTADVLDNQTLGGKFADGMRALIIITSKVFAFAVAALCEIAADGLHAGTRNPRVDVLDRAWVSRILVRGHHLCLTIWTLEVSDVREELLSLFDEPTSVAWLLTVSTRATSLGMKISLSNASL